MDMYILIDGEPVKTDDIHVWGRWMHNARQHPDLTGKRVARTDLGECEVSTVFLAMDHRYMDEGPPILWETMIFGGPHDQWQDRYDSVEAAKMGHQRACRIALGEEKDHLPE